MFENEPPETNLIQNPVGVSGLTLSLLVAVNGLVGIVTDISAEVLGAVNLVLASGVALISEIVRKK